MVPSLQFQVKGGAEFTVGTYEWIFYAGDYFASKGTYTPGNPFLDVIPLRFGIDNPGKTYFRRFNLCHRAVPHTRRL